MKTIRLIMMFFIICMLGACTAEELAGPESGVEDDAPVVIAISPADITSVNMNSRAAGDNSIFSVIDDVNVKVNYGGNTVIVYLVKNGDSFEVSGSVENGSAEVVSSKTADGKVYIHINAKQGNQAVRVEVIANYGRKITLSLWQSVKESLIQWPVMKHPFVSFTVHPSSLSIPRIRMRELKVVIKVAIWLKFL